MRTKPSRIANPSDLYRPLSDNIGSACKPETSNQLKYKEELRLIQTTFNQ
jgi:hypothetical protein